MAEAVVKPCCSEVRPAKDQRFNQIVLAQNWIPKPSAPLLKTGPAAQESFGAGDQRREELAAQLTAGHAAPCLIGFNLHTACLKMKMPDDKTPQFCRKTPGENIPKLVNRLED